MSGAGRPASVASATEATSFQPTTAAVVVSRWSLAASGAAVEEMAAVMVDVATSPATVRPTKPARRAADRCPTEVGLQILCMVPPVIGDGGPRDSRLHRRAPDARDRDSTSTQARGGE